MDKETLQKLKDDKGILYIYKIPNSSYEDKFEYVVVGRDDYNFEYSDNNVRYFTSNK
jgi:hypothetical protein